jgi:predicted RNase H-like nuclease
VVVGVDGCKAGWLAIKIASSFSWEMAVFREFVSLWANYHQAQVILVDIPLGLKAGGPGERVCDQEARRRLGPKRGASVFPVPYRPTVHFFSEIKVYQKVSQFNRRLAGKGLSRQTFNIIPRILEMDRFLLEHPEARKVVRETHPEICFWAFNRGRPMAYSKTRKGEREKGLVERLDLLQRFFPPAGEIWTEAQGTFRHREVSRDDILDALVAAVTGLYGGKALKTLPPCPQTDSQGIPMEIVYFAPGDEAETRGAAVLRT